MLLQMQNVFKQFFGVNVLSSVDFDLKRGEAHALLGLNGAGKSTLINIISGLYEPDYGHIWMNGRPVKISSPAQAQKHGIFTIHQAPALVENLSVAENIFLGNEPRLFKMFTDFKTMKRQAANVLNMLGNPIDPELPVRSLSLGEKYEVAIAKCFVIQPNILILDEPTAGLSERERTLLFELIRNLKRRNTGIIYITHRLNELPFICDRITILKDGRNIVTCGIDEMSEQEMIETMCGKMIVQYFPEINPSCGQEVLKVENLRLDTRLNNVSFSLREGEVLGIAGLAGSGKKELAKTIFGHIKKDAGRIWWRNKEVHFKDPSHAVDQSFGYISDNRIKAGLFMDMGVTANMTIASLKKQNIWQLIRLDNEKESAVDKVIELDIKIRHLEQEVKYLSGGNQQKVLLGRWMMSESELYILEEPTQGIDVASKSDIYLAISDLANQGKSFILMSDDIKELIGLCSRIIVMHQGAIVDEMSASEVSEERILRGMKGAAPLMADPSQASEVGSIR
jgi:ABC-type sugar transport system ATPase subunit